MTESKSTIIVDQYRDAATAKAGANSYAGLRIHALPGLHDFLAGLITQHVARGSHLLDLAAGSGAMSARLMDLGYVAHASDYVTENFRPADIPFTRANLNEDFSHLFTDGPFQAIVASEIIEHLENPRHFLRECHKALFEGGHIILSTPNIQNSASIASFIRSGTFLWFSDLDYSVQGHIMPLTSWQIGHCLKEAGFSIVWTGSFGSPASRISGSPRLKLLAKLIDAVSRTPIGLQGEIYVCIARKRSIVTQGEA